MTKQPICTATRNTSTVAEGQPDQVLVRVEIPDQWVRIMIFDGESGLLVHPVGRRSRPIWPDVLLALAFAFVLFVGVIGVVRTGWNPVDVLSMAVGVAGIASAFANATISRQWKRLNYAR